MVFLSRPLAHFAPGLTCIYTAYRKTEAQIPWTAKELQDVNLNFSKKILFSYVAHFHLSGHVNEQDRRIWGDGNPHNTHDILLDVAKVTVWYAL